MNHYSDVLDFRGLTLEVDGLAETACVNCDLRWTTDGQEADNQRILKDAFGLKRDALRAKEGLLSGPEIEQALLLLGLKKADAAELFGGGPNAFAKYIAGDVLQSVAMDRLIRLTYYFQQPALLFLRGAKGMHLARHAESSGTAAGANAQVQISAIRFDDSQAQVVRTGGTNDRFVLAS